MVETLHLERVVPVLASVLRAPFRAMQPDNSQTVTFILTNHIEVRELRTS